ncbi:MAG: transposase [Spirulinaceae cyanobacterium SM2_1_0]|nr:transposase [Spirulinaceae cyanobacterium SM2_1_0]
MDEAGVNLSLIPLFARARRGQRAYGARPERRGQNVSLIGALSLRGVIAQTSLLGAVDGLTFEAFVAGELVPKLWPGADVVMDNASIHQGDPVAEMIRAAGAHLLYLPTYSPDFSPIENLGSKLKHILRSLGARAAPDLLAALEQAYAQITQTDIQHWFAHCCYCTSLA